MADKVTYGNTVLKGINKAGNLKPDENGYYTVVLGAIGVMNSGGECYPDTEKARATFNRSGSLLRRINQGLLRGEYAHPDPAGYPNMIAFERRVRQIKEDRICMHIADVWLEEIEHEGKKLTGILGRIRPTGPYGKVLKEMLDNPEENVTFSGRYYSDVYMKNGVRHREIHTVGTWDFVSEPGVAASQKYCSPTLESADETVFYRTQLEGAVVAEENDKEMAMSMESSGITAETLVKELGFGRKAKGSRASLDW